VLNPKKGSLPGDQALHRLIWRALLEQRDDREKPPPGDPIWPSLSHWFRTPPAQAISLLDSHLPPTLTPLRLRQMSWSEPEKLDPAELQVVAEALVKAMSSANS
jgi:hypothetical protein